MTTKAYISLKCAENIDEDLDLTREVFSLITYYQTYTNLLTMSMLCVANWNVLLYRMFSIKWLLT